MSAEVLSTDRACLRPVHQTQRTLQRSISFSGHGLFTGKLVNLTVHPAPAGHGVCFQRTDFPLAPPLCANLDAVKATPRCTILGNEHFQVQTVEHLLSALRAFQIDNALVVLDGSEVPIGDGSALPFTLLFKQVGIEEQSETKTALTLAAPIFFSQEDAHLIALPSQEFQISYTLHYPHSPLIRTQFFSYVLDEETYGREIAPCRTFCLHEEIAPLVEKGLIRGGGLESAVVIAEDRVLNLDGLRFADEMVRHKILDLIGDLSLIGIPVLAHIIAIRSGHTTNVAFARLLQNQIRRKSSR